MDNQLDNQTIFYSDPEDQTAAENPGENGISADDLSNQFGFDYVGGLELGDGMDYSMYGDSPYAYDDGGYYYGMDQEEKPIYTNEELLEFLRERAAEKKEAHPVLVLALLLLFFPAGLVAMLFFTRWGGFAKTVVTLFVLAILLAVYEIIVSKNIVELPSVIEMVKQLIEDLF